MKKLFTNSVYILVLACCGLLTLNACGNEDNPEPIDTGDTNGGKTDAGTIGKCGDDKCEGNENCESCLFDCHCSFGLVCWGAVCLEDNGLSKCDDYRCEGKETCSSCPHDCDVGYPEDKFPGENCSTCPRTYVCDTGTICQSGACVSDPWKEVKMVLPGDYLRLNDNHVYQPEVPTNGGKPEDVGCKGLYVFFQPIVVCIDTDLSLSLCKDGESTGPLCATDLKNTYIKDGQISADCSVLAQFGQDVQTWCESLPSKAKCATAGECGAGGVKVVFTVHFSDDPVPITYTFKKN